MLSKLTAYASTYSSRSNAIASAIARSKEERRLFSVVACFDAAGDRVGFVVVAGGELAKLRRVRALDGLRFVRDLDFGIFHVEA